MAVIAVSPEVDAGALLPGAQFIDAYSVGVAQPLDARQAAIRMMTRSPRWVAALMALRNIMVAPLGLSRPQPDAAPRADRIGIFPVISETPQRLIAGFDDSHLDFRVVVDVAPAGNGSRVTASTLVLTHNLIGRSYLAVILPFHRLVVRAMLRQV